MSRVLLVRHASNDWVGDRLAGWTAGVHLNARGHAEAAALAARLAGERIDAVYASPLDRTQETAAYLAAPRGLAVQVDEGLGEVRFGDWTGRKLAELRQEALWSAVQSRPSVTRFPGGETLGEVQARAVAAVEAILARHEAEAGLALVSHADVIKTLLAYYAGVHLDLFQRLDVAPASVSLLELGAEGPRVLVVNHGDALPARPAPADPAAAG